MDLQAMARSYLSRLRYMARKHGLGAWLEETIIENKAERCEATEKEVRMLSRLCGDERVARTDVPRILGKSYRESVEDDDFSRVRRVADSGTYDKVSVSLLASKKNNKNNKKRK